MKLTQQEALDKYTYFNGYLFSNSKFIASDKPLGYVNQGYLRVHVGNEYLSVHRIIFMMHHGYLPTEIDHIDENKLNNKIENLRHADRSINMLNIIAPQKNNKLGVKGVYMYQGRYCANFRRTHLGRFSTLEEAKFAYDTAKSEYLEQS